MVSIPGWAYAVAGAVVSGYAWFIRKRTESGAMQLFFWVGVLLLVVGVFKLVVGFMTREPQRDDEPKGGTRVPGEAFHCPRCNARLHPQSRYCNWCGAKQ